MRCVATSTRSLRSSAPKLVLRPRGVNAPWPIFVHCAVGSELVLRHALHNNVMNETTTKIFPYLERLLDGEEVEWKTLGEVAEFKRGQTIMKKTAQTGVYPVISGGQQPAYYIDQYNRTGQTITVAGSGAYAGFVMFWDEPIFVSDAFSIKTDEEVVLPRYVFHFLLNKQSSIFNLKRGAGVPHVYAKDLAAFSIPIPPLRVQSRIVEILDKFTQLEAQLEAELQAELEARRKQYAYYRDQLLNFSQYPPP